MDTSERFHEKHGKKEEFTARMCGGGFYADSAVIAITIGVNPVLTALKVKVATPPTLVAVPKVAVADLKVTSRSVIPEAKVAVKTMSSPLLYCDLSLTNAIVGEGLIVI